MSTPQFSTDYPNPFGLTGVNPYPHPVFVDIDDDGDLDAFVASWYGDISFFENTGTTNNPSFATGKSDPFGLSAGYFIGTFTFADIDGDGDMDVFAGDPSSYEKTRFWENTGTATQPAFAEEKNNVFGLTTYINSLADIDGDGDLDAFTGDGVFIENTGTVINPVFAVEKPNPFGLNNTGYVNLPHPFVDIDGDGDLDAFGESFFENTGTVNNPAFSVGQSNLFGLPSGYIDSFVDIDGDGDLDAFTNEGDFNVVFFENTGTVNKPSFIKLYSNPNPFGLSNVSALADIDSDGDLDAFCGNQFFENTGNTTHPTFTNQNNAFGLPNYVDSLIDIDDDGDLDAFVGNYYPGDTLFFENTGTVNQPSFADAKTNPFGLTNVSGNASPTFADIDGDGDWDAFVGEYNGNTVFFENTGTASQAAFAAAQTNSFGLVNVGSYANPTFADIDNDGDFDAFIGSNISYQVSGTLFFKNTGTSGMPAFDKPITNPFGLTNIDLCSVCVATPKLADIDGDHDLDAFINDIFFENDQAISGTEQADNLDGSADADIFNGLGGADRIDGKGGNDILDGGADVDTLIGGMGDDSYYVDSAADVVNEAAEEGKDSVYSSFTYSLPANVENLSLTGSANIDGSGNTLDNLLKGNNSANRLDGDAGADTLDGGLGADTLAGGADDDIYLIRQTDTEITEKADEGIDTVQSSINYTLSANLENLTLTGSGIEGTGNALDNLIIGTAANNSLAGGLGVDTLQGEAGDDVYVVNDSSLDEMVETADGGVDTVQTSVSYVLAAQNVENVTLTGTDAIDGSGNGLGNLLSGNSAANALTGNAGNDTLTGGGGNDSLSGGADDDAYIVNSTHDVISEDWNAGTDEVQSSANYTLPADSNLENLTLTGAADIDGIGNGMDNQLVGNAGANMLQGEAGNDVFVGGNQAVSEIYTYNGHVYLLSDAGSWWQAQAQAKDLGGSLVTVNNQAENDWLFATFVKDDPLWLGYTDRTTEGEWQWINGESSTYTHWNNGEPNSWRNGFFAHFIGGSEFWDNYPSYKEAMPGIIEINNLFSRSAGNDTFQGGAGDDTYLLHSSSDKIKELSAEGSDTVESTVSYDLSENVENITLTGKLKINSTGNTLNNVLSGNDVKNILAGLEGDDTLKGGSGKDGLWGGIGDDVQHGDDGNDTLGASRGHNKLDGGAGNDTLICGKGNNVLTGGDGLDTFIFKQASSSKITDFVVDEDLIELNSETFTSLNTGILDPANFNIGTQAADADDYVIYTKSSGELFYDADGNGAEAAVKIALIGADFDLSNADFVVV